MPRPRPGGGRLRPLRVLQRRDRHGHPRVLRPARPSASTCAAPRSTPRLAATLVHELTHALQDQTFLRTELMLDPGDATSGDLLAIRGARRGRRQPHRDRLRRRPISSDEQAEITEANEEGLEDLDEQEIPEALLAFFGMPVRPRRGLRRRPGGRGAHGDRRAPFERPADHRGAPARTRHRTSTATEPDVVSASRPGRTPRCSTRATSGRRASMLVLGSRIDPSDRLCDAAIGWGGDAYVELRAGRPAPASTSLVSADVGHRHRSSSAARPHGLGGGRPRGRGRRRSVDGDDVTASRLRSRATPSRSSPASGRRWTPSPWPPCGPSSWPSPPARGAPPEACAPCYGRRRRSTGLLHRGAHGRGRRRPNFEARIAGCGGGLPVRYRRRCPRFRTATVEARSSPSGPGSSGSRPPRAGLRAHPAGPRGRGRRRGGAQHHRRRPRARHRRLARRALEPGRRGLVEPGGPATS